MKPIKLTDAQMDAALGLTPAQVDNVKHVRGFTDIEIAAAYGIPVATVRDFRGETLKRAGMAEVKRLKFLS